MEEPLSFDEVLEKELDQIDLRRGRKGRPDGRRPNLTVEQRAFARGTFGICLSGGGIRSATLNLGILQGLTEKGLLPYVDYLSTVSGGGYIGGWLLALLHRKYKTNPALAGETLNRVVPLSPDKDPVAFLRKYSNYLAARVSLFSADIWVIAAIWIRNMFLNLCVLVPAIASLLLIPIAAGIAYAPRFGQPATCASSLLFTLLLLWAVLSMGVRLFLVLPKASRRQPPRIWQERAGHLTLDALWCAVFIFAASVLGGVFRSKLLHTPISAPGIFGAAWAPFVSPFLLFALFFLLQIGGGFPTCYSARHNHKKVWILHVLWMPALSTAVTTLLAFALFRMMSGWSDLSGLWNALAWGPPLLIGCLGTGVALLVGMMGADFHDAAREWLSRVGAILAMIGAGWMALNAIAVFMPYWLAQLFDKHWVAGASAVSGWLLTSISGVLAGNSAKTKGGSDIKTGMSPLEFVGKVAPTVFLVGFLTIISFGLHAGLRAFTGSTDTGARPDSTQMTVDISSTTPVTFSSTPEGIHVAAGVQKMKAATAEKFPPHWTQVIQKQHWYALDPTVVECASHAALKKWAPWLGETPIQFLARHFTGLIAALLFGISSLAASRININEFSMHHFYKNRLVRCYLGASHTDRQPNAWTGFDPEDDLPITVFKAAKGYRGPYPIVNTTVNISRGTELAKQDRKAESFVFTPLYSGFTPMSSQTDKAALKKDNWLSETLEALWATIRSVFPRKASLPTTLNSTATTACPSEIHHELHADGYRETSEYGGDGGICLGTAMGISGAAASPNSGYHTSGPLAFLLTVFNVRLGWWLGNPRRDDAAERPGPAFALWPLVSELTGSTDERSKYVNLSDGGHFDNLGLCELVRRRCRYIIVGDGESDKNLSFESLASAMRKCRADFGVDIEIDVERIRETNRLSGMHCVMGRILYPWSATKSKKLVGYILYFKSSLTGDESEDVRQYRTVFPDFPHQSTGDQFFNEAQFESYRQLGLHIVRSSLQPVVFSGNGSDMAKFFRDASGHLFVPVVGGGIATRFADIYSALLQRLSGDPELRHLDEQIIKGVAKPINQRRQQDADVRRRAFFLIVDCIQLMENVYLDLLTPSRLDNPGNFGWVAVFQHWVNQPNFQEVWSQVRGNYNERFQQFFESGLPNMQDEVKRIG